MSVRMSTVAESSCVCTTLRRISRAVTAAYDEALRPSGLRITQFAILRTLARVGPVAVTRLAAETGLDRSTMGRNLDPLERRDLVRIAVGEADQRERVVHLTQGGTEAIALAVPFWTEAQARLADDVQADAIMRLAGRIGLMQAG